MSKIAQIPILSFFSMLATRNKADTYGSGMDLTTLLIFITLVLLLAWGNWVYRGWHAWKVVARPVRFRFAQGK